MTFKKGDHVFFSVVMPCYNAEKTIEKAIYSCVNQSFKQLELVIVDDASVDDTVRIVSELIQANSNINMKVIKLDNNSGPSVCRNLGWELAEGEFIAFLDADDVWHKNKLEICYNWIKKLECDVLAHSYNENLLTTNKQISTDSYIAKERSYFDLLMRNISQTSCVLIKNNLKSDYGFDTTMRYTEDHELWLRVAHSKAVFFLCGEALTSLGRPQLSKGGLSGNRWAMRKGEMKMYLRSARYSKISFFTLPLLIMFSLLKYLKKDISLRMMRK
jgi:glycosyltransferase involved in cell wall biosynthesis